MSRTTATRGVAPAAIKQIMPAPLFAETNVGQIIEYLPDRLYLASYLRTPNEDTLFPFPEAPTQRLSTKRSSRNLATRAAPKRQAPYYFTIDDSLPYNAFHHDFGPLHIGHLYRFALEFHEILGSEDIPQDRPIVLWSRPDPRSRANAACLLACYMVLIQAWPPHLALAPIAQADPPFMPFRDAGYSQADYGVTIQDVVYGVWKAKEERVCDLDSFNLMEYETYERVENGDFNWITPHFLAFASPMYEPVNRITDPDEFALLPRTVEAVRDHPRIPDPFKKVLMHFKARNIGLVVRLNSELYSPSYFEALGIKHLDMIFEDGTCPQLSTVRKFIKLAHDMITRHKKGIAVHCKAGLGRTGCLIGAYLIYRYGFTADECISFMRFMRPGMVVGPQQHWLHIHQGVFREWWVEERVERKIREKIAARQAARAGAEQVPSTPVRAMQGTTLNTAGRTTTPPNRSTSNRAPLGEMGPDCNAITGTTAPQEDYLPAPTPGQPRKTARTAQSPDRHHPYQRSSNGSNATSIDAETREAETMSAHHRSQGAEEDEEWYLRMRMQRKASAAEGSPVRSEKTNRSASRTTTTTTIYHVIDNDASNDIENIGVAAGNPRGSKRAASGNVMTKVRNAAQPSGVRKTSGRVGSVNGASAAATNAVRRLSGQAMI